MMKIIKQTMVGMTLTVGTLFALPTNHAIAACSNAGKQVWQLPLTASDMNKSASSVFKESRFGLVGSVVDRAGRLGLSRAPDGTPAIKTDVRKGENKGIGITFGAFKSPGIEHACLSLSVYLSQNFDIATAGTKLGWGLWGGAGSHDSGGVPPEMQKGWTVRNATSRWGARVYSYHLNRERPRANQSRCAPFGCMYGQNSDASGLLPSGRWVKVDMEVRVNDLGKTNGFTKLWIDGKLTGQLNGQEFRTKTQNWLVRGLQFTDMWGGTTSAPKNFSPKPQSIWYANYKIFDMTKTVGSGLSSLPTSSISSGGLSGLPTQSPANIGGAACTNPQIETTGNDAIASWASGNCRVKLVGPSSDFRAVNGDGYAYRNLPDGSYKLRVRTTTGDYSDIAFKLPGNTSTGSGFVSENSSVAGNGQTTSSIAGAACTNPQIAAIGNDAIASWASGNCRVKLVGPSSDFRAVNGDGFAYRNLPDGSYKLRVRTSTGNYSDVSFKLPMSASHASSASTSKAASLADVVAVAPSGRVSDRSPTMTWRATSDADKYYVKIVGLGNRSNVVIGRSVTTSSCSNSECKWNAPQLASGDYEWKVRKIVDGKQGDYQDLRFSVR